MLCLSGFVLYSRWVPLKTEQNTTLVLPYSNRSWMHASDKM